MLFIFFIFHFLLLGNFTEGKNEITDDLAWHEIKPKSHLHPCGRFNSLTWVDDQDHLWLYGGKTVMRTNGSQFEKDLHDLWRFSPRSCRWTQVLVENSSNSVPQFDIQGFSCFCQSQAFIFGHPKKKQFPELWTYNISSNFWSLIQVPSQVQNCFTAWCDKDSESLSLLCHGNITNIKLLSFKIESGIWKQQDIANKLQLVNYSSKSRQFSIWNDHEGLVFIYIWSYSNAIMGKNSILLSIDHGNITITHVIKTKLENLSSSKEVIKWVDNYDNLDWLGGSTLNFSSISSAPHWMFNKSDHSWVRVYSMNRKPSSRTGACIWQVGGSLWLFGGYVKHSDGRMDVLKDFWMANCTKHVIVQPMPLNHDLPGDSLGLSLMHKLIISVITLFIVMVVSVRLCYKRELNLLMSRLSKNRVLYHQVSQEGDKSTRL